MSEITFNGPQGKLQAYYKPAKNSKYLALILHPRDCMENSMNNNVVSTLFDSFYNNNFSTLKFNFRGVEKSEGKMEEDGLGELSDAATALDWLQEQNPDINKCWIAGVSFGAWVGSQMLMRRPEVVGFINVAIPTDKFDFSFLSPCPASGLIIQPNQEQSLDNKACSVLAKKLSSQKNISITYKLIKSDINFDNKEKEIKEMVNKFISKLSSNLEEI